MMNISKVRILATIMALVFVVSGCAVGFYKRSPNDMKKIEDLSAEVERLKLLRSQDQRELEAAKAELEKRLRGEAGVSVGMDERGVVVTFISEVLFDSGKAKIRAEAHEVLDKVAKVINDKVADKNIAIEGHTDNQPIRFSAWKSNWELSTARALSVLHYLDEKKGISPQRLSAIGYGEFQPVDTNDTVAGRQANRRVEIVILPKLTKVKEARETEKIILKEPPENLK